MRPSRTRRSSAASSADLIRRVGEWRPAARGRRELRDEHRRLAHDGVDEHGGVHVHLLAPASPCAVVRISAHPRRECGEGGHRPADVVRRRWLEPRRARSASRRVRRGPVARENPGFEVSPGATSTLRRRTFRSPPRHRETRVRLETGVTQKAATNDVQSLRASWGGVADGVSRRDPRGMRDGSERRGGVALLLHERCGLSPVDARVHRTISIGDPLP